MSHSMLNARAGEYITMLYCTAYVHRVKVSQLLSASGAHQIGTKEICSLKICVAEIHITQVRPLQIGSPQIRPAQLCTLQQ